MHRSARSPMDVRDVRRCAGLEGPIVGLFENAAMIVLLAALMLFAAFWLPFTIGRCVLSALAGLQPDHASLVLKAMAHDPAQLHRGALVHTAPRAPGSVASPQEDAAGDAAGLAAAVMVLERVLMVHLALISSIVCTSTLLCTDEDLLPMQTLSCYKQHGCVCYN